MTRCGCWVTSSGSPLWIWLVDTGRWPCPFERLMDRVLCGMRWSRCLVYLDDVISISEAQARLEEVLCRLSDFGLQLKAKS